MSTDTLKSYATVVFHIGTGALPYCKILGARSDEVDYIKL